MFNKETEYALRALVCIQVQNTLSIRPGIALIAKEIDAPPFYTAKILQRLVRQGIVKSAKGKGGGFFFDKEKVNIPIKNVIEATEGTSIIDGCGFGLNQCDSTNPCPIHEQYAPIREAINTLVSTQTIQSLAKKYNLKQPK